MQWRIIIRFTGLLIFFLGLAMLPPMLVSIHYRDGAAWSIFSSLLITTICGGGAYLAVGRIADPHLGHRDGAVMVTLGWALAGLFGMLPYVLAGAIPGLTDAYFESVSGFTTTGASILTRIEPLPRGLLLWRSQTQWLGGMGIIVLSIAILPFLGVGGMQLYKAEIPSPVVDKLKPRIRETARLLWKVYVLITGVEILLLIAGGMPVFDAFCHAFCTLPTGGFSTHDTSVAAFGSLYFETIFIIFMLLAGINFSLHYRLLTGRWRAFLQDAECRVFLGLSTFFTLLVAFDIFGTVYQTVGTALRYAAFQVASIITTTGFATADYDQWPALSQFILLICMFLGGMAGSTGGGIKVMRIMLLARHSYQELFRIIHPHAVTTVKLGGRAVPAEVLTSIWGFFTLYMGLFVCATLIMAALGLDLVSAFASVAATIGNIGPGLGLVGPAQNFAAVPLAGKWLLIVCMLLGRLEIYTIVVLLVPEFWRR